MCSAFVFFWGWCKGADTPTWLFTACVGSAPDHLRRQSLRATCALAAAAAASACTHCQLAWSPPSLTVTLPTWPWPLPCSPTAGCPAVPPFTLVDPAPFYPPPQIPCCHVLGPSPGPGRPLTFPLASSGRPCTWWISASMPPISGAGRCVCANASSTWGASWARGQPHRRARIHCKLSAGGESDPMARAGEIHEVARACGQLPKMSFPPGPPRPTTGCNGAGRQCLSLHLVGVPCRKPVTPPDHQG